MIDLAWSTLILSLVGVFFSVQPRVDESLGRRLENSISALVQLDTCDVAPEKYLLESFEYQYDRGVPCDYAQTNLQVLCNGLSLRGDFTPCMLGGLRGRFIVKVKNGIGTKLTVKVTGCEPNFECTLGTGTGPGKLSAVYPGARCIENTIRKNIAQINSRLSPTEWMVGSCPVELTWRIWFPPAITFRRF